LNVSAEVSQALASRKPVVALESTIIAHGMPYPQNVATALEVEQLVRSNGAVPATIALLDGKLCVGLNQEQLELLGKAQGVWKVSLRDMPYVISNKLLGATTVAATMRIAHMAGIRIFVTGGIGGVHRGAGSTMDISADLTELAQTPVAVVSAGVKSILDIGLTLEYLETKGIPVVTVGQDVFPSFYSRESAFLSPLRIDEPEKIAGMIRAKRELGLPGSVLIANPVPAESEIPFAEMEVVISGALAAAGKKTISGKQLTPFLLQYISDKTGGKSLRANIALVKNNAVLGAKIAILDT
jgi:pseudouridine-5'-phosphate glycosidase